MPTRPPPPSSTAEPVRLKTNPPTRPPKQPTKQALQPQEDDTQNKRKQCRGECVSGLFALFCDDLDADAFCPGEASCCVTGSESDSNNDNKVATTTTPRPTQAPV